VSALLTWLSTAESYLSETKSVLGDVETVGMLIQQHQVGIQLLSVLLYDVQQQQDSVLPVWLIDMLFVLVEKSS